MDRKAVGDLLARLKGCLAALEGEAARAEAVVPAPSPAPPPLTEEEAAKVKQLVEESEGLVKDLKEKLTPPAPPPTSAPAEHKADAGQVGQHAGKR
jgi:hypothetical protein